jgi:lincosamide nucleotidyltransferase A/C/D/E
MVEMDTPEKRMPMEAVVDFHDRLHHLGIEIWIDGGWGVDALLGRQTRPHRDLDIAIQAKDAPAARALLEELGYHDVPRDDTSPWNFVLGDAHGHEIDFHVIVFDAQGNGILGPPERGSMYPAGSLTGNGRIGGRQVACISPEHMVKFHTGYKLRNTDYLDVSALCDHFGIEYPPEYEHLRKDLGSK